ncbi:hypothetical protein BC941DRAFT_415636 [Chlamydoabsidia padenii]|nr:hypothetical protein BC941DRAFT_415636 [Chlamydoabsidia padenii]
MSMLIDSLMKKYYIPPLLFAVRTDENGNSVRVCIDGKQRLTSILKFTRNEIPYLDESSNVTVDEVYFERTDEGPNLGHNTHIERKYLSEEDRENFNDTEIVMIEFSDLDEDQELEIFARVQMGVSITAAEKLLATNSPASKFCRELLADNRHLEQMLKSAKAVAFQNFSQLLYILHEDSPKYIASHNRLMEFLKNRDIVLSEGLKRKVRRTINLLDRMCQNEEGKKVFFNTTNSQGVTKKDSIKNIEFTIFGVYVSKAPRGIEVSELVDDLASLRLYLREEYGVGLYAGNPCWKAGNIWATRTLETRKRRMAPANRPATTASSSTTTPHSIRRHGVTLYDSDDQDDSDNELQSNHHRAPIPASKRRRAPGNNMVATKVEEETTPIDRPRPLARRGGKKTGSFGRY